MAAVVQVVDPFLDLSTQRFLVFRDHSAELSLGSFRGQGTGKSLAALNFRYPDIDRVP
jgi:hypothetical protein